MGDVRGLGVICVESLLLELRPWNDYIYNYTLLFLYIFLITFKH